MSHSIVGYIDENLEFKEREPKFPCPIGDIEFTVTYKPDGTGLLDRLRDRLREFEASPSLSARIEIIDLAVETFGCSEIVGDIRKSTLSVLDYHSLPESFWDKVR